MIKLDGYQLNTPIYTSANSTIYRGIRQHDRQPIILKVLNEDSPTSQDRIRYRQEYDITQTLNFDYAVDGVIKAYALEDCQGQLALVLEDFGGISLKQAMQSALGQISAFSSLDFLTVALQITEILAGVHQANVIHKDINPGNILIHPQTKLVKLIDFGISTVLSREKPSLTSPNVLEGTLAYISPEQTGRMNRSLDYRTDFYSLGASFYELLTGQVPFEATDPLELVHAHIARQPQPVHQINPQIPLPLSQIVAKLMAKTAEERYQSAWGLQADLERCRQILSQEGETAQGKAIAPFPLGQRDIADTFQIPQTLYGRETEVQQLLGAFHRVAEHPRSELMLVAGYSGIGKSALVKELYKPITQARGYFITGKFDQFQRNIPYSAIVAAFQGLVRQILTESEAELQQWRDRLIAAVGNNGQVIIDVIPEFELIIGPQPALPELGAAEQQNRFNFVFQAIIQAVSTSDHPLVLFLDDLQWVDAATLNLMELVLVNSSAQHLLVIGAYRDNEVYPGHPLTVALPQWQQQGSMIERMTLAPLELEHISQLIGDTLRQDVRQQGSHAILSLSQLVMQKTRGNPFFVNEFLRTLHSERLLNFNRTTLAWEWQIDQIRRQDITDNVVDLMIGKIQKLPPATQSALQIAACIGAKFSLKAIARVLAQSESDVFQSIKLALLAGLIYSDSGLDEQLHIQHYGFGHDRIQQAAYALIDEPERQSIHFKIGMMLLQSSGYPSAMVPLPSGSTPRVPDQLTPEVTAKAVEENFFTLVNQINMGRALVTAPDQRQELAQLNVEAGKKAKQSTAYAGAIAYFKTALDLLGEHPWQEHYDLTALLHQSMSATYYSMGEFEAMAEVSQVLLQHGRSLLDKAPVYAVRVQAALAQGQFQTAVTTAIEVAQLLGVSISDADLEDPLGQIETIETALGDRTPEALVHLPVMSDAEAQAALQILSSANSAAYVGVPAYLPSIVSKQVQLLIHHGNVPLGAFVYAWYGTLLCGAFLQIETGYAFGQLALAVLDTYETEAQTVEIQPKTVFMVNCMIAHWKKHVRDTLAPLMTAYQTGREIGDVEYASWAILVRCEHLFCMGQPLNLLEQDMQISAETIEQFNQDSALFHTNVFYQATLNLLGKSDVPHHLSGSRFNDQLLAEFKHNQQEKTGVFHAHLCQLHLAYLFEQYDGAIAAADAAVPYLEAAAGLFAIVPFYLYDSLVHLASYSHASSSVQKQILQRVTENQQKMHQWATQAPANHQHKYDLVQAEWCRVQGHRMDAMEHYDRAIASAKANGYIHEEALACELAAQFYRDWGKAKIAQVFLQDAYDSYRQWGAIAKVHHLESKHPELSIQSPVGPPDALAYSSTITINGSTQSGLSSALDVQTVLKASQAISSEIVLDKLLGKLMQFVLENAGAERGQLMLMTPEGLNIEAQGTVEHIDAQLSLPLSEAGPVLPLSVVQYVQRTQKALVLSSAVNNGQFTTDPYVVKNKPQSILCTPILDRGKLLGLVYLENTLTPGVFTRDRLELVTILASQAAISLENALLYRTLEDKVIERTAQLADANQEIMALNKRLEAENIRLSTELEITQRLQQMILPKPAELERVGDLDIAGFMAPADEVGGDYYDVLYGKSNVSSGIKIGIGDVTGHGLESGVLMLMVQTAVRTLQESDETDPVRFLDIINRTIYKNIERMGTDKNLTLALLDYSDGQLRISGQHEELIVVRVDGTVERIDTIDLGFPIGLDIDIADFIAYQTVSLSVGDVAVLYTDGITEAENQNRVFYGIDRLCQVIRQQADQSSNQIRQAVIADVREHIGTHTIFDDITLVVLKRKKIE